MLLNHGKVSMIKKEIIDEVKNRLVATYNPLAIYLFGSYAWGKPTDDSDLDLLIVIDGSEEKAHRRTIAGHYALAGLGIAKDISVYTKKEFLERCDDQTTLVYAIKNKGKLIYARA